MPWRIAFEKAFFQRGKRPQRIAVQRRIRLFEQARQRAGVDGLRVAAVAVQGLPHGFDQRGFAVEQIAAQGADAAGDLAAQPRRGQLVGQRQQLAGERPPVHIAQPFLAPQHGGEPREAPRLWLGNGRGQTFGPGFQRGDAGWDERGQAGGMRKRAGEILAGAVIGNEYDEPGKIRQRRGMLQQQMAGDLPGKGGAVGGNQGDSPGG